MVIPSYLTAVTYTEAFGPKGILQSLLEPFRRRQTAGHQRIRRRDADADYGHLSLYRSSRPRGAAAL